MTLRHYLSPNGDYIIGTSETILAIARISGISTDTEEPEYEGGTEINWNTQETVLREGKVLFVCQGGKEWTFDQLTPADLTPEP